MLSNVDAAMDDESDLAGSEIQTLRNQIQVLQSKVDRSAAKIMSLQSDFDQITDGDVRKRFEDIFGAIQDWVGEVELDLMRHSRNFQRDFDEALRREEQDELLYKLNLCAYDEDESGRLVWDINRRDHLDVWWLNSQSTWINIVLSRLIWYRLRHDIFRSIFPVGLNEGTEKGLDYIISAIKEHDHGKTTTESEANLRANKWRAESMATLVLTKRFRKDTESRIKVLVDHIYSELANDWSLIDQETFDRHIGSLEINVLRPAVELNHAIACSSTEYCLEEPRLKELQDRDRLGDFVLKDVVKWRNAKPSETYNVISCLFSGIDRKGIRKTDNLTLVKPTVLVLNKEAFDELQDYKMSLRPPIRQRSPLKAETAPSRKMSPSLPISRSSPVKSSHNAQRHRIREDPISDQGSSSRLSRTPWWKGLVHDRKAAEATASSSRPRHNRRATDDRELRRTPSRELKDRERRNKRNDTTSTSSRKSSISSPRPGISMTPSASIDYYPQARAQTIPLENHLHVPEEGGRYISDLRNMTGSPVPMERREDSDSDSVADVRPSLEFESETVVRDTRKVSEAEFYPARPARYHVEPHPRTEEIQRVQDSLRRKSVGPGSFYG